MRVSTAALSTTLLICSAVWFVGGIACCATSAFKDNFSRTPLIWMLSLMVTPAMCFSIGVLLVNSRQQSRLSRLDWCALVTAFLPVILGTVLVVWTVKTLLWASFQDAPVVLKSLGTLASLALIAISGSMIWKTTRNYLSGKPPDKRQVA
jgi:hypothetical protein